MLLPGSLLVSRLIPPSLAYDMINDLRWFPILGRVRYKILLMVVQSQQGLAPKYICEFMSKPLSARSSRPLRSADLIFLYLGP